jgi:uncharacterized protein YndB with AHSA1/START domain
MARSYAVERLIDASPEQAWSLLTDAQSYRDWNKAVVSLEGRIAVDEKIKLVSVANPKRVFSLTVTEMRQPHRMVWSDGMPLGLFRGVRTFALRPQDGGGTVFSMEEVYSGPLAPLISKAIPDLTKSFDQFADGLKQAAETDTA